MAHFAQISSDSNVVIQVIVVNNDVLLDDNGVEQEQLGIDFCKSIYGQDTNWVQTSYNNNFRKRFAGVDMIYNSSLDVFIDPQPFPSWTFNSTTTEWDPPIAKPIDVYSYFWDEDAYQANSSVGWKMDQPGADWTYDSNTLLWSPPFEAPNDGNTYRWDEDAYQADTANPKTQGWVQV